MLCVFVSKVKQDLDRRTNIFTTLKRQEWRIQDICFGCQLCRVSSPKRKRHGSQIFYDLLIVRIKTNNSLLTSYKLLLTRPVNRKELDLDLYQWRICGPKCSQISCSFFGKFDKIVLASLSTGNPGSAPVYDSLCLTEFSEVDSS